MRSKRNQQLLRMVQLAILTAVVLVLQTAGIVIKIPVLGTPVSLVLIPIALGAMILGPAAGAWLGFVFGAQVYIVCGVMGADPFTAFLFTHNPIITAGICLVKSTLAGFLAGYVYRLLKGKNELLAVFLAAAVTPVVNTGVFVVCMLTFFKDVLSVWAGGGDLLAYILTGLVVANFLPEMIINVVFGTVGQRIIGTVKK